MKSIWRAPLLTQGLLRTVVRASHMLREPTVARDITLLVASITPKSDCSFGLVYGPKKAWDGSWGGMWLSQSQRNVQVIGCCGQLRAQLGNLVKNSSVSLFHCRGGSGSPNRHCYLRLLFLFICGHVYVQLAPKNKMCLYKDLQIFVSACKFAIDEVDNHQRVPE